MSITNFYNNFHNRARIQSKLINDRNITYRVILSELNSSLKIYNYNILDYGCGVGTLVLYYASKNNSVIGVDVSDSAIRLANESKAILGLENKCTFYTLKESKKYLSNKKYNLIICSEVIEHVNNDTKLIKYFNKLIKKNGFLFITTPSIRAPLYRLGLLGKFDSKVGHLRRYDQKELEKMIISSKYKIIFSNKTEGVLRNLLYTNKYLGFLLKFLKGIISDSFTVIDNLLIPIFGESNIHILAKKL